MQRRVEPADNNNKTQPAGGLEGGKFYTEEEVARMLKGLRLDMDVEAMKHKEEVAALRETLAERDGTALSLQKKLASANAEIAKLKTNPKKEQKRMGSYFKTQGSSSRKVETRGIQTETNTAKGSTDLLLFQDIELQLGLADLCRHEGLRDRSDNPGYARTGNCKRTYRRHVVELKAFLDTLHAPHPGNIAMRGELVHGYICQMNDIPCHLGERRGVASKSSQRILQTFKAIRDTIYN